MSVQNTVDFQLLTEYSVDLICSLGLDRRFRYASPSSMDLLGWSSEELVGKNVEELIYPVDLPILNSTGADLRAGKKHVPVAARMMKRDGSLIWMEVSVRLVWDPVTGEPTEAVVVMRDISERKQLEEKLSRLALTDSLTGLGNRRAFDEALNREWKRTLQEGSQLSLLLLDIDYFKKFNDEYGHQVGDDCLRAVASAITHSVRKDDTVARYGGEEIAIVLPGANAGDAINVAEGIRAAIEALQLTHGDNASGGGKVSASIGVATALARHGGTMSMPEGLLLAVDGALYRAKHEGRNRIVTTLLMAPQLGVLA